jgi:hypothetical protein
MYFYKLKTKQNEQAELLEMRCAFGFSICTNPILFFLNNPTYFNGECEAAASLFFKP